MAKSMAVRRRRTTQLPSVFLSTAWGGKTLVCFQNKPHLYKSIPNQAKTPSSLKCFGLHASRPSCRQTNFATPPLPKPKVWSWPS